MRRLSSKGTEKDLAMAYSRHPELSAIHRLVKECRLFVSLLVSSGEEHLVARVIKLSFSHLYNSESPRIMIDQAHRV